jgi:DUF4097 and DUF4098 domain-containing protein YvlB
MKRSLGVILALAGYLAAMPAYAQEQTTARFSDPSRPGLIKVNWHNGSITIKTHTGNDVTISSTRPIVRRGRVPREPREAVGLQRIDTDGVGFVVDSGNNNVITISSGSDTGTGTLEIEVPVKTNLNLESHNGASISIEGVEGDIEATNHNGSVNVMNAVGSVVAYSHNGRVTVSLRDITAGKPMSFTSMNGNVDVTLPPAAKADLKMRTDNGGIWSDFELQKKSSSADRTTIATLNGGGASFELRSHNGNIYLRKAK